MPSVARGLYGGTPRWRSSSLPAYARQEMEEELKKLVGMESVKQDMRKLCKQLSLDIRRRQQGCANLNSTLESPALLHPHAPCGESGVCVAQARGAATLSPL